MSPKVLFMVQDCSLAFKGLRTSFTAAVTDSWMGHTGSDVDTWQSHVPAKQFELLLDIH